MSLSIDIQSETSAPTSSSQPPGPEFEAMLPENLERYRPGPRVRRLKTRITCSMTLCS